MRSVMAVYYVANFILVLYFINLRWHFAGPSDRAV